MFYKEIDIDFIEFDKVMSIIVNKLKYRKDKC